MLTNQPGGDDIKLFEGDDAIKLLRASELADDVDKKLRPGIVRQSDDVVQTFARPVFLKNLLLRHEDDACALPLALAQKLHSFEIARQTNKGWRARDCFTHKASASLFVVNIVLNAGSQSAIENRAHPVVLFSAGRRVRLARLAALLVARRFLINIVAFISGRRIIVRSIRLIISHRVTPFFDLKRRRMNAGFGVEVSPVLRWV